MANYQLLKADIDAKVYQNGVQEITGANLNAVLNAMVTTLGAEYQFAGVATIDTKPGAPDAKVFYIANGKGSYTNFGGLEVTEDDVVVLYWDSSWHKVSTGIASNSKLTELEEEIFASQKQNVELSISRTPSYGTATLDYDSLTITRTSSGNNVAMLSVNNLVAGKRYRFSCNTSQALDTAYQQNYIVLLNYNTLERILVLDVSKTSHSGEFTAPANLALQVGIRYNVESFIVGDIAFYEVGQKSIKNDLLINVPMSSLDEETRNKILEFENWQNSTELVKTHYPAHVASFTLVSETYLTSEIGTNYIALTQTSSANAALILLVSGIIRGHRYKFKAKASHQFYAADSHIRLIDHYDLSTLAELTIDENLDVEGEFITTHPNDLRLQIKYWNTEWSHDKTFSLTDIIVSEASDVQCQYVNLDLIKWITALNMDKDFVKSSHLYDGQNPTTFPGNDICAFNKGLCIGDSLTAGVFNATQGGTTQYITIAKYSYPTILSKITGVDMVNKGQGGQTIAQWYNNHSSEDLSGFDFAIIQLGVNDAIQNQGWTTEADTSMRAIIAKLKSQNSDIKVFVATIIPASSYSGTAYDSVSDGIKSLVESLSDTNVILLDMALYGNTLESDAYNIGHLTAYGYWRLANDYKNYISWYMSNHKSQFNKIQFIGTNYQ